MLRQHLTGDHSKRFSALAKVLLKAKVVTGDAYLGHVAGTQERAMAATRATTVSDILVSN